MYVICIKLLQFDYNISVLIYIYIVICDINVITKKVSKKAKKMQQKGISQATLREMFETYKTRAQLNGYYVPANCMFSYF